MATKRPTMDFDNTEPHEGSKISARVQDRQADLRRRWIAAIKAERAEEARLIRMGVGGPLDVYGAMQHNPCRVDFAEFVELRCGARGKRTGQPCPHTGLFANGRCRWHGGLSTGPKTAAGKTRSAMNGLLRRRDPES